MPVQPDFLNEGAESHDASLDRRLFWAGLSALAESVTRCAEAQPTKEFVTAEQVGAIAVFLCLDPAAQITGANISIDGGWVAG